MNRFNLTSFQLRNKRPIGDKRLEMQRRIESVKEVCDIDGKNELYQLSSVELF